MSWLCCVAPEADQAVELLVPWYVWPSPLFDKLVDSTAHLPAGTKSAIIVGSTSGPERPKSDLHWEHWAKLHDAGWTLYAYVHCVRGDRPLSDVTTDIDDWVGIYGPLVDGIFLDECPSVFTPELLQYCKSVASHARKHGLRVALNPGTRMHDGGELSRMADIVVTFEASHDTWDAVGEQLFGGGGRWRGCRCDACLECAKVADVSGVEASGCGCEVAEEAAIIHSCPPPPLGLKRRALSSLLRTAAERGFRYVYATDHGMPDPYSCLPGFWEAEVAALNGAGCRCPALGCVGRAADAGGAPIDIIEGS